MKRKKTMQNVDFIIAVRKRPPQLSPAQWDMVDARTGRVLSFLGGNPLKKRKKR